MLCFLESTALEKARVFFWGEVVGDIYEICADEAWTHGGPNPNRYWCFFGGVLGRQQDVDRLETDLRKIKNSHHVKGEVKWSSVSRQRLPYYKDLVDCLLGHVETSNLRYRQIFLDRSFHWQPFPGETLPSPLDVQFKICYQFLKHSFGLKHLPAASGPPHQVLVRLDNHSSQKHKDELVSYLLDLPTQYGRNDLILTPTFINSKRLLRLQVCDVVMGAAGSHGNKMHLQRPNGRRGMNPKQRARYELARHVYEAIRELNGRLRGKKAFNWFESTGLDGDPENSYEHRLRIWKFIPRRHLIDKGWQNDNLDRQGRYQGPQIVT